MEPYFQCLALEALPSHILYADDILVFCRGTKRNVDAPMSLFSSYSITSGQHLSIQKCKFYVGCLSSSRVSAISNFHGFNAGHLPFMYLGVPIFKSKPRSTHLQPIVDKVIAKLASWKGALLSFMGRVQLVKSVVTCMLLHIYGLLLC